MAEERVQRKLAAILAADVVGYSRLVGMDEEGTIARLKCLREELIDPSIAKHRGRIVKTTGDGILAEFPSVVDAVRNAVEVQRALAGREVDVPEDRRIRYRIGINLGDIVIDGDDILGDGVNVAARLEALANPGGICVSGDVFRQVEGKLDLGYESLGEQRVKNIEKPVRVYRVLLDPEAAGTVIGERKRPAEPRQWWAFAATVVAVIVAGGGVWWWRALAPDVEPASIERMAFPLPEKPSIAVLPFDNLSGNPEQDWLGEGLTENIIAVLSTSPNLFVIARNSTFTYKGKAVKVQQVAEELGVRHVLEGSVQRTGDKLRITAQLVDALTGRHLWAERYDRNLEDLFALQDEITHAIITALQVKLTQGEQVRIGSGRATNFEAWELEQRSLHLFQRFTRENNTRARQLAESSVDLDPNYALAWVRLAWTHALDVRFVWVEDRVGALSSATEAAQKALALDETLPDAHAALGFIHTLKGEHEEAVADMRNAVALDPNHATAMALLAVSLTFSGSPEEAITLIKKAMRLSPYYPAWYPAALGRAYRVTGQFDEAIAAIKKSIERNPDLLFPHVELTAAYSEADRSVEARTAAGEVLRIDPKFTLSRWAKTLAYRDSGEQEQYLAALRKAGLPEHPPLALPQKPSIAVLPFTNMSDDAGQEYFADGMTDDLITDLSKISGLFVIARNSSFSYKGQQVKVRQVAEELGVRYVLEGSVRRAGDQVRINTQLIDATTGGHVWAERYDRKLDNIFAVQDAIIEKVVQALELHLTETEKKQRDQGPQTTNLEAYDLVLRARKLMTRFDHKAAAEARDLLQRAIEIDPAYTEAYSLLGFYYFDEWRVWGRKRDQNLARALELGTKAVELSPSDPAPHVLLALVYQWRREFDAANAEADTALALQPNDAITLSNLGSMLTWADRSEEALGVLEQAVRLDPFHPPNYMQRLAFAYAGVGEYEQCVEVAKRAIALDPNFVGSHVDLALCYAALGADEEARGAAAEIIRTNPRFTLRGYAAYAPYTNELDLKLDVERLRKAGVP